MSQSLTSDGEIKVAISGLPTPSVLPAWAFKNRLTASAVVETDYTHVTGPTFTLEAGVFVTLQSNANIIIVG